MGFVSFLYSVMKPPRGFLDFIDNHVVKLLNILIF